MDRVRRDIMVVRFTMLLRSNMKLCSGIFNRGNFQVGIICIQNFTAGRTFTTKRYYGRSFRKQDQITIGLIIYY